MTGSIKRTSTTALLVVIAVLLTAFASGRGTPVIAGPSANKAGAAASSEEVFSPGEKQLLLSKQFKAGGPIDVVLQVTAECSIVTNVQTIGNQDQSSSGHIEVWVELDNVPVTNGPSDHSVGRVVFCDRTYRRQTTNFSDDEDDTMDTIQTYFNTRSAHGFNWVALDLGSGLHSIKVYAKLTNSEPTCTTAQLAGEEPGTCSQAVVGNRTLVIEPARFSNGADTISS